MKKTFFKIFIVLFPVFDDYFKFVSIIWLLQLKIISLKNTLLFQKGKVQLRNSIKTTLLYCPLQVIRTQQYFIKIHTDNSVYSWRSHKKNRIQVQRSSSIGYIYTISTFNKHEICQSGDWLCCKVFQLKTFTFCIFC